MKEKPLFCPIISLPPLRCFSRVQLQSINRTTKAEGFFRVGSAFSSHQTNCSMDEEKVPSLRKKQASSRICLVSSFSTELLEMHSEEPKLHVLFIPGNPGVVSFYKDFVEASYELLDGSVSITAIGHIAHTRKDWEHGRMFSLQEQIDHKVDFIKQELQNTEHIILVGHSIGSYICLEVFKKLPQQIKFAIGLYPFLTLNRNSFKQSMIGRLARSSILSASISLFFSSLGFFPAWILKTLVKRILGHRCSSIAVDATCSHLLQYHTMCNVLFMAKTEFAQLSEEPDWSFIKEEEDNIALLYGIDDHWGPLSFFEEISQKVPGVTLSIEKEGHTHSYCCTEAGSVWVARYVADMIRSQIPN